MDKWTDTVKLKAICVFAVNLNFTSKICQLSLEVETDLSQPKILSDVTKQNTEVTETERQLEI